MNYAFYPTNPLAQCPYSIYHHEQQQQHHVCYNLPGKMSGCALAAANSLGNSNTGASRRRQHYLTEIGGTVRELYRRKQPLAVSGRAISATSRANCCGGCFAPNTCPTCPVQMLSDAAVSRRDGFDWSHDVSDRGAATDDARDYRRPGAASRKNAAIRSRHPVTFRAARYVRRPGGATLSRKPSTLSLKLSCQPDPVLVRQPSRRRVAAPQKSGISTAAPPPVRNANSEGDHLSGVDSLEKIAITLDMEDDLLSQERKEEIRRLSRFVTPRVPSSIKNQSDDEPKTETSSKIFGEQKVRSIPKMEETLDTLLDHLKRCELTCTLGDETGEDAARERAAKAIDRNTTLRQISSFNLQDLYQHMPRSMQRRDSPQNFSPPADSDADTTPDCEDADAAVATAARDLGKSSSSAIRTNATLSSLDDGAASELHKSKSYIVNLIDRALSRELGTKEDDRCDAKEFANMTPVRAIGAIDRRVRIDTAENSNRAIAKSNIREGIELKNSAYSLEPEEPTYIKQLKDLRWGHFRHIQQEVKRLEDLERFLDSCGVPASSF